MHFHRRRSAGALIASGAATITLDQRMPAIKMGTSRDALIEDRAAIRQDAERAYRRARKELQPA